METTNEIPPCQSVTSSQRLKASKQPKDLFELKYARCVSSRKKCLITSCGMKTGLQALSLQLRADMMKKHRIYIPVNTLACKNHNSMEILLSCRDIKFKFVYNKAYVEDLVELLCNEKAKINRDIPESLAHDLRKTIGLTIDQFNELYTLVPSLLIYYKNNELMARTALYTYLFQLRTGHTHGEIGDKLKVSRTTVSVRLNATRDALYKDFVPHHLNCFYERADLERHTSTIASELYCAGDKNKVVLIWDGTYIYINKSGNFRFQKYTYNDQKKRNFVKPMMGVATDGTILFVYGLYPAVTNDAKIIEDMTSRHASVFDQLQENDVMLLDRGFRDCVRQLKQKGFRVEMPKLLKGGQKQFSVKEANESRLVTKCRFMVETKNGHMKSIWKSFSKVWDSFSLMHLKHDFCIGAALLNKFYAPVQSDEKLMNEEGVARRMLELLNTPNIVWDIIKKSNFEDGNRFFDKSTIAEFFPELTPDDLFWIALGTYQIRMARSYYAEHIRESNGFEIEIYKREQVNKFFGHLFTEESELYLVRSKIKSRFQSQKIHKTYVLVDAKKCSVSSILGYCCTCKNGLRTIGCCSHVMLIIWYFGYAARNRSARGIASFLDNFFIQSDDDSDPEDN